MMDKFEEEIREALERRPAPPGLKRRIFEERDRRAAAQQRGRSLLWMRLAASLALAAGLGSVGTWQWHRQEEQRKGEEARRQVEIALRITGHALDQVQARLAAHTRNPEARSTEE